MRPWLRGVLVGVAVVATARAASAQQAPRVAVGPFTGSRPGPARVALVSSLAEHAGEVQYVRDAEFTAAASRLGLESSTSDPDVAAVARDLRLDAVVVGDMARRGRIYVLRLRVVRARDGSTAGTASWELDSPADATTIASEIWEQLRPYLRAEALRGGGANASGGGAAGAGGGGNAAAALDAGRGGEGWNDGAGNAGAGANGANGDGANRGPNGAGAPVTATPGLGFLAATVSGGMAMRFWRMPVLGELSPRGYENTGYPEVRAELSVLARWARQRAGFGAFGQVAIPVTVASRAVNEMGEAVELPTSALELWGGVAGAVRPPGGGLVRALLGVGTHSFTVDTSALPAPQQLTPVSYTGLRGAIEGVLPLYVTGRWELGVLFGTELRIVAVGAEIREAFGEMPATTFGFGALLGVNARLDGVFPGLAVRASVDGLRYRTSFAGRHNVGPGSDSVDDYVRIHLAVTLDYGAARVP